MDVKYLKYILTIAEQKNMTKAAAVLFVSQSSLSQYLTRLEQELGTPLFLRAKNELILTPAGELYVDAAKKVLQIQQQLYQDIASLDQRGRITVGVTSNFGLRMLSDIIPRFKRTYPKVSIEITEVGLPALKQMVQEGTVDIGIAAAVNASPFEQQSRILRKEEVLFAVPKKHPYVLDHPDTTALSMAELVENFRHDNFLLPKQNSSLRDLTDQLFHHCGFVPNAFCETNNIAAIRTMVSSDAGVSFIAESCSIDRDAIQYYSLTPAIHRLNLLYTRKNWVMNEPERVFFTYLTEYFNQQTQSPYLAEANH